MEKISQNSILLAVGESNYDFRAEKETAASNDSPRLI